MTYILKNTSGLINSRLTDAGRLKLSEGNFNISYFQIGDSEVSYNTLPSSYNQYNTMVLEPNYNSQNSSFVPETNKQYVKYPYFVQGNKGNTYGIPFMDSSVSSIYNRAAMRGFFTGDLTATTIDWSARTNSSYVINSNYVVDMLTLSGGTFIDLIYSGCNTDIVRLPKVGDIITIYYDGNGLDNCYCEITPTPTSTSVLTPTPTPTPSSTLVYPCNTSTPTPTPTSTVCLSPTPKIDCTPTPLPECVTQITNCYPILTYKIVSICGSLIELDRPTPDYSVFLPGCYGRILIYPSDMFEIYDSVTPRQHWKDDVINFESICDTDQFDVKIWNMNIPWSESPAGLISTSNQDYTNFGSIEYLGSKEYFGYASSSGQTDTDSVYYYNSFSEKVIVTPEEQKSIAIIHYTNQTIDNFYGEKFALEPYSQSIQNDTYGQARNFKLHIPWLMWHKSPVCCSGQTFWVDPPGFDNLNLFEVHYMESKKNSDMNNPGLRYYHLWDTNVNTNGYPNRIGKVFPDDKIVIIDDEEIIAAMSYKSNRNWTLPAPKISLVTPNTCGNESVSNGILTGDTEYLYVTYRFSNSSAFTESLHCNYYVKIQGPKINCNTYGEQNVAVRFGPEFECLNYINVLPLTLTGFIGDSFQLIVQKVEGDARPNPAEWKIIDYTEYLSATTINGYITQSGLTGTTFVVTQDDYDTAPTYNLDNYIDLPQVGQTGVTLNFGDEYYFYGSLETDIQATIYEMKYKVNLGQAEFQTSQNPSWTFGNNSYITEIGLYDSEKNLMIVSKMQSPILRTGIQQFLVKFDF
jgi:hypothetical protein